MVAILAGLLSTRCGHSAHQKTDGRKCLTTWPPPRSRCRQFRLHRHRRTHV